MCITSLSSFLSFLCFSILRFPRRYCFSPKNLHAAFSQKQKKKRNIKKEIISCSARYTSVNKTRDVITPTLLLLIL